MADIKLIAILAVLVILNIIAIVFAILMYRDTKECEENESLYCPQYVCPDNKPATRVGDDGKIQMSEF